MFTGRSEGMSQTDETKVVQGATKPVQAASTPASFPCMATVDIEPLALPLPGGSEDATVTVRPLLTGEIATPPGFFDAPKGKLGKLKIWLKALRGAKPDWDDVPVPVFLVTHPTAGHFLIDTGMHRSCAHSGGGNLGPVGRFYRITMNPGQSTAERLEARGISPESIRLVVMTHLHNDHASACKDFPNATFVADTKEWEAAHAKRAWQKGYVAEQFDLAVDWRGIDYFGQDSNHFAGFSRTVDLFGDGSVHLVSTPGHADGHQSVILRLDHGEILVTGDAAPTVAILNGEAEPLLHSDRHQFQRSLREIRTYMQQTPNALVIPGHDVEAWNGLEAVYGSGSD